LALYWDNVPQAQQRQENQQQKNLNNRYQTKDKQFKNTPYENL
jgi:hypothetical protein